MPLSGLLLAVLLSLRAAAEDPAPQYDPGAQKDASSLISLLDASPSMGVARKALETLINMTPGMDPTTRLKALSAYIGLARSGAAPQDLRVRAIDAMAALQPQKEETRLREEGARALVGLARSRAEEANLRRAALDALPDFITDGNEREAIGLFLEVASSHSAAFAPPSLRLTALGQLNRPIADNGVRLQAAQSLLLISRTLSEPADLRVAAILTLSAHVDAAGEQAAAAGLADILGDRSSNRLKEERQAALRTAGQIKWLDPRNELTLAVKAIEIVGHSGEPESLRVAAAKALPRLSTEDHKASILQTLTDRCSDNSVRTPSVLRTASCASAQSLMAP